MSANNNPALVPDDSALLAMRLAAFEKSDAGRVSLGVVTTVRNDRGKWTLRCSSDTEAHLETMRTPLEAYAKKWLAQPEDVPPDFKSLADEFRPLGFDTWNIPASEYPICTELNLESCKMGSATMTDDFPWRKWVSHFKEGVSLSKDLLDVSLKLSPLGLIPPAIMLAIYLRRIGWGELLLDSIGSFSGLTIMLACMVIFTLLLVVQFCLPSLLIAPMSELVNSEKGNSRVRMPLIVLCLGLPLLWMLCYFLIVLELPWLANLSVLVATGVCVLVDLLLLCWLRNKMNNRNVWRLLFIGLWPLLGALSSIFPLIISLQLVEKQSISHYHPYIVIAICALVSVSGVLPGLVKLTFDLSAQTLAKKLVATLGTFIAVFLLLSQIAFAVAPVSAYILAAADVYSLKPAVYQIRKSELANAFWEADMRVFGFKGNKSAYAPPQFVHAYLRYNFGGSRLLCRDSFDPSAVTQKQIDDARQHTQRAPYLIAGDHCVPVKEDDVTPIRGDPPLGKSAR